MSAEDVAARPVLVRAFGRPALLAELQAAQAIGRFEGFYGYAKRPAGWYGSHNWGAIHCKGPPCGETCFEATDTDAQGKPYATCIQRYPTADAGAAALLHELYRRPEVAAAMPTGDLTAIASAMRRSGYFESNAAGYAMSLYRAAQTIAGALSEPLAVRVSPAAAAAASSASSEGSSSGLEVVAWIAGGLFLAAQAKRKRRR